MVELWIGLWIGWWFLLTVSMVAREILAARRAVPRRRRVERVAAPPPMTRELAWELGLVWVTDEGEVQRPPAPEGKVQRPPGPESENPRPAAPGHQDWCPVDVPPDTMRWIVAVWGAQREADIPARVHLSHSVLTRSEVVSVLDWYRRLQR